MQQLLALLEEQRHPVIFGHYQPRILVLSKAPARKEVVPQLEPVHIWVIDNYRVMAIRFCFEL